MISQKTIQAIKSLPGGDKILATKKEKLVLSHIRTLDFENSKNLSNSKIGGQFYWLKDESLPLDVNGTLMFMICQINFEEIPNCELKKEYNLDKGILQFFIARDNTFGLTFGENDFFNSLSDYEVKFHADPVSNVEQLLSLKDFQKIGYLKNDEDVLPIKNSKSYDLNFELSESFLTYTDDYVKNYIWSTFDNDLDDNTQEVLFNITENNHHMLGYANFTQSDPRVRKNNIKEIGQQFAENNEYVVLLGLDSQDDLMWGDCGIANWFIKKHDLINKNINKQTVKYSWDCC